MFNDKNILTVEQAFNPQKTHLLAKSPTEADNGGRFVESRTVMVFGAICVSEKCPLVFFEHKVEGDRHVFLKTVLQEASKP